MNLRNIRSSTYGESVSKSSKIYPWEKEAIKDGITNILNNNYEHILTDSFLDYISTDSSLGFNFEHLSGDENSVLFLLSFHHQYD